jgi:SAM-dependent methyltransferase
VTAVAPEPVGPARWFGSGGDEPWAGAMTASGPLYLLDEADDVVRRMQVERWIEQADAADRRALRGLRGPVLDIGCGPGRMVRAALDAGLAACGLDVAPAAVTHCRGLGLPVLARSVFDPLPHEGTWGALLLLDGNIGIGGDVQALLARCRTLLRPDGACIVETARDRHLDTAFLARVVDGSGRSSEPFAWAEVGEVPLLAAAEGFFPVDAWTAGGRRFLRLRRLP